MGLVAGGEGQGAREIEWTEVNLLVGLGETWGGRMGIVGERSGSGGGVDRRRGCSSKGRAKSRDW